MLQKKQADFEVEKDVVSTIVQLGMAQYVFTLLNLVVNTKLKDRVIRCIDGRTPGGIHIAPLLEDEWEESVNLAVEFAKKAKAEAITFHLDCGAVKAWLERHKMDTSLENVLKYAEKFAKEVAERLKLTYRLEKISGHAGFHRERAVYYSDVDFDPSTDDRLPTGFFINRKYLLQEHALKELSVALQIATGSHGFGKLFSQEQPFLIIVVAGTEEKQEILREEVQATASIYGKTVRVDGFVMPER